ncbi:LPS translocon maturation chaperone LptM [Rickettsia endosymbiont of Ceutorhynchus assimilis]
MKTFLLFLLLISTILSSCGIKKPLEIPQQTEIS